jgi:hypothetical protein
MLASSQRLPTSSFNLAADLAGQSDAGVGIDRQLAKAPAFDWMREPPPEISITVPIGSWRTPRSGAIASTVGVRVRSTGSTSGRARTCRLTRSVINGASPKMGTSVQPVGLAHEG